MPINKRNFFVIAVAVLIFAFIIIKNLPSEKKKAVQDIKRLAQYVQQEYWDAMVPYLDPAYQDQNGLTYQNLSDIFAELFREVDSIEVILASFKPRVDSTRKTDVFVSCSLEVKVLGRSAGTRVLIFGEAVKPAKGCVHLKKFGDRYRVYCADY